MMFVFWYFIGQLFKHNCKIAFHKSFDRVFKLTTATNLLGWVGVTDVTEIADLPCWQEEPWFRLFANLWMSPASVLQERGLAGGQAA